jgi:hypothetical protein
MFILLYEANLVSCADEHHMLAALQSLHMPSARPEVTLPPRMNFKTTPERLAEVARLSTERV